jgi:hypothetical protein
MSLVQKSIGRIKWGAMELAEKALGELRAGKYPKLLKVCQ